MEERFKGKITEEQYALIDKLCEEKKIRTESFLDFLIGYKEGNICYLIDKCIDYFDADGYNGWRR